MLLLNIASVSYVQFRCYVYGVQPIFWCTYFRTRETDADIDRVHQRHLAEFISVSLSLLVSVFLLVLFITLHPFIATLIDIISSCMIKTWKYGLCDRKKDKLCALNVRFKAVFRDVFGVATPRN